MSGWTRFVGDDGAIGNVDPFAVIGDAGVGANGADEAAGGGFDILGALDNKFEGAAEFAFAKSKETECVGVTVDNGAIGKFIVVRDLIRAAPVEEVLFDPVAFAVAADGAATLVVGEGDRGVRGEIEGRGRLGQFFQCSHGASLRRP